MEEGVDWRRRGVDLARTEESPLADGLLKALGEGGGRVEPAPPAADEVTRGEVLPNPPAAGEELEEVNRGEIIGRVAEIRGEVLEALAVDVEAGEGDDDEARAGDRGLSFGICGRTGAEEGVPAAAAAAPPLLLPAATAPVRLALVGDR